MNTPLQSAHNQGTPLAGNGIARPLNGTGTELVATGVSYNPHGPDTTRATVNIHIHNPNEAEGDIAVALVWASALSPDAPFLEVAGKKIFEASGTNRSGHISIDFSADELTSQPPQANFLIAVVSGGGNEDVSDNATYVGVERKIYLNFDGASLSRNQLESWAGDDWKFGLDNVIDPERDGVEVGRFFEGHGNRDQIIQGIHYQIQKDLAPYNITVQLTGSDAVIGCLLYTSPSPRDQRGSRMPSSA